MADILPLVTFRSLDEALRREPGRLEEGMESASRREHVPKAVMLSQLSQILSVLERAERKSGILIAPDDRLASLLQTYLAKRAAVTGSLVSLPSGGVEAKFDSFDIGGWMGSLFLLPLLVGREWESIVASALAGVTFPATRVDR